MSANFTGQQKKTTNLNNEAYESAAEHPPQLKFAIGLAELAFGIFTNCIQVSTSAIAILSMILASQAVLMSPGDILRNFGWKAIVSLVIAFAIQLFLHKNAQSMSSTWGRLRQIQNFNIKSNQAWVDVFSALSINQLYFALAIIADIISDATFVNLFTRNAYVIVGWMLFLTGSSTLLMYDGATRIWGSLEDWKDYRAYHRKHDTTGSAK